MVRIAALLGAMSLALGCGKTSDGIGIGGGYGGRGDHGGSVDATAGPGAPGDAGGATSSGGNADILDAAIGVVAADGAVGACPGTQVRIRGRCVTLGTVKPCAEVRSSGFPGDSQCIEAPLAASGMQLHYGPHDYTDPDEVAKFVVAPGNSASGCMFMKTPNSTRRHVKEWHARVRPGAYEAILFGESAPQNDSTGPESCATGGASPDALVSVVGTDLDLSFDGGAPEYAGAAMTVDAAKQVAFLVDTFNTTDAPLLVEAWLNGLYADEPVRTEVAPATWLGGLSMNIRPHTSYVVKAGAGTTQATSCVAPADVSLLALVGSTGSHTTRTTAYLESSGGASRTKIYESFDWSAPVRLYYDSVVQNPTPDQRLLTTGGPSGVLTVRPGDAISWECAIDNTTDASLTYSDDPMRGELCNFYGVYAGGTKPWSCYSS